MIIKKSLISDSPNWLCTYLRSYHCCSPSIQLFSSEDGNKLFVLLRSEFSSLDILNYAAADCCSLWLEFTALWSLPSSESWVNYEACALQQNLTVSVFVLSNQLSFPNVAGKCSLVYLRFGDKRLFEESTNCAHHCNFIWLCQCLSLRSYPIPDNRTIQLQWLPLRLLELVPRLLCSSVVAGWREAVKAQ